MPTDHPLDPELQELRQKRLAELQGDASSGGPTTDGGASGDAPGAPVKVTDADVAATVQQYPVVVVDVWAPWCGPCRAIAPVLEELAQELQGRVVIAKLNSDENPRTPSEFGVQGIPTLLIFKDGKLVDRIVGAVPKEPLKKHVLQFA